MNISRPMLSILALLLILGQGSVCLATDRGAAERLTLDLAATLRLPHAAQGANVADLARQRHARMLELLESDPAAARRLVLPDTVRQQLPAAARAWAEQPLEVEGEVTVWFEDYDDPAASRQRQRLETADGNHLLLRAEALPANLSSGDRVRAAGLRFPPAEGAPEAELLLDAEDGLLVLHLDGDAQAQAADGPTPLPDTRGAQRTLVLLVNFQDRPDDRPWSVEQARSLVFDTVADFLLENSYGLTWLEGETFGWFTIPHDSTSCLTTEIAGKADQAASAAGIDLAGYRRLVYIFPRIDSCGWAGAGTVGGKPSRSWSNGRLDVKIIGHELGHNFGLRHAHALECGGETLGEVGQGCTSIEYGDHFDVMGNTWAGHYNAFHKALLGWLGQADTPAIETVSAAGRYPIAPYVDGGLGPAALKIARAVDPVSGAPRWYYLEYRQAKGHETYLAGNANLTGGVLFHSAVDSDRDSSFALDLTPASQSRIFDDREDPALVVGSRYVDEAAGLAVETAWAEADGAAVDIELDEATCVPATPGLALSPGEGQWAVAGSTLTYTLNVQNLDSTSCPPAGFTLEAQAPTGWPAPVLAPTLTLAPGEVAGPSLSVASPATATGGVYEIAVTIRHAAVPNLAATGSVTYVVEPEPADPVAVDDSASTTQDVPVIVPVLANDWHPLGQPLSVVAVTAPGKGQVRLLADGRVEYTPAARFKGSESFGYRISDGLHEDTATVTVSVERSDGNGGGGGGGGGNGGNKGGGKPGG